MGNRADAIGLFWQDVKKEKAPPKEKIKREPPHPFWLDPNYLPGLAEARLFDIPQYTDADLVIAAAKGERLVWDIESYPNYWCVSFKGIDTGKSITFEIFVSEDGFDDVTMSSTDYKKLDWILRSFCIVSFNGRYYDEPIMRIAMLGFGPDKLWSATEAIIQRDERGYDVMKAFGVKPKKMVDYNHIDLKEVAPLHDSLKIYAGRMHTRRLQDLPFPPGTILTRDQAYIVRYYNLNDLRCTEELHNELLPAITLREQMSKEYSTDLRSKSDAQVAEAVILSGLKKLTGQHRFKKPEIKAGHTFKYQAPSYVKYQTPLMNWVLDNVLAANFTIGMGGEVEKPYQFPLNFKIADTEYTMGIGGLHSNEKSVTHRAGKEWLLIDRDVASFYPRVILTQRLYPEHLGPAFLKVYETIVSRRLAAKDNAGALKKKFKGQELPKEVKQQIDDLTIVADSLKITINGSFGKFGNAYSMLYSPNLMIQVTLTGQLALLMLIERLELASIKVASANTDGIIIKARVEQRELLDSIIKQWETDIDCQTEETQYVSTHNRDVNNYFAIKDDGEIKVKGVYAERGSAGNSVLSKNPSALIVSDAVKKYLLDGTPTDHTIRACKDIRRFTSLRNVKGGAVKVYNKFGEDPIPEFPNEYLGKTVRWYYSSTVKGEIVYARNGNKVSNTDGARPLMELPAEMPSDIDYAWYEEKALKVLEEIGLT